MPEHASIAYFSMEFGIGAELPTYSGGLGILAGDTLRAAADLALPMVGITLVHRAGYFTQSLSADGNQSEAPVRWDPAAVLKPTGAQASVAIDSHEVRLTAWRADIIGAGGAVVPVFLIDADVDGNEPQDRRLTDSLYGGDHPHRLRQEIILGIGGVRILRSLGYSDIARFHMNEGHSSLLTAELLREVGEHDGLPVEDPKVVDQVRQRCVFTTHTPVAAGHDKFDVGLVHDVSGPAALFGKSPLFVQDGQFDTTFAALNLSGHANAVSKEHGVVARAMFPGREIDSITNGVHPATWIADPIRALLDRAAPGWQVDSSKLAQAAGIPLDDLRTAHLQAKQALIKRANTDSGAALDERAFTIGCARRATPYKRLDLVLSDIDRLGKAAEVHGPIQLIFAGKAHPRDGGGKDLIRTIFGRAEALGGGHASGHGLVRVVFLPNYDMALAKLLVSGVDLWLNTPLRPLEASGTSGMKAAMNAVPSLSVPDGWWIEGCVEGVTGWAIGDAEARDADEQTRRDTDSLYKKLEGVILPMYYKDADAYARVCRGALSVNGPVFNTHRMVREYVSKAYRLDGSGK